jgi:hypothetical protein
MVNSFEKLKGDRQVAPTDARMLMDPAGKAHLRNFV